MTSSASAGLFGGSLVSPGYNGPAGGSSLSSYGGPSSLSSLSGSQTAASGPGQHSSYQQQQYYNGGGPESLTSNASMRHNTVTSTPSATANTGPQYQFSSSGRFPLID